MESSPFILVVRMNEQLTIQTLGDIARLHDLEFSLTGNQIYLFIPDAETLLRVAHNIRDKDDKL